jgi:hypothetical protein
MSSAHQIAANRENSKKSTGPRTRRGKSRISGNAVRHGLAAVNFGKSGISDQVQRLAKAICNGESDPFRYEQAVIIAETQILLARVRAARIAAIERSRKPGNAVEQQPLIPGYPTDDELRIFEGFTINEFRKVAKLLKRMTAAYLAANKKYIAGLPIWSVPRTAEASDLAKREGQEVRDDLECFVRALPELLSLQRYERRALARRRRAIRRFDSLGA